MHRALCTYIHLLPIPAEEARGSSTRDGYSTYRLTNIEIMQVYIKHENFNWTWFTPYEAEKFWF